MLIAGTERRAIATKAAIPQEFGDIDWPGCSNPAVRRSRPRATIFLVTRESSKAWLSTYLLLSRWPTLPTQLRAGTDEVDSVCCGKHELGEVRDAVGRILQILERVQVRDLGNPYDGPYTVSIAGPGAWKARLVGSSVPESSQDSEPAYRRRVVLPFQR